MTVYHEILRRYIIHQQSLMILQKSGTGALFINNRCAMRSATIACVQFVASDDLQFIKN